MTSDQADGCQHTVGSELLNSQRKEGNMNGNKIPGFTGGKQSRSSGEAQFFLIPRLESCFSWGVFREDSEQ